MTTRDPRSRDPVRPDEQGYGRDPTQSLSLPPDEIIDGEPSHPSLALGTHDAGRGGHTKLESPAARGRTNDPAPGHAGPPPIPRHPVTEEQERVGTTLGSYKIVELLGKGGMGCVFRAEHVKLGREVALKLLRGDYARRRDAVARFFQEARTVNRVRHRNIVDVTDFVELEDGTTFIIMELLRGQSLGKWARTGIDMPRALAVLVQISDALGAAHQVGVVHRDLKPDNIIVVPTSDGAELVKLLDFGVAKLLNRDDEDVSFQTAAGSVIGTPAYMSPEQAGGMLVDARSDIYSLGAIMYELFCGQPMFRGRSFGEYVRKHLTEAPLPPRATVNGAAIDPQLEALILRSLEKDPDRRFGSIFELRDSLLGMLAGMEPQGGFAALTSTGLRASAHMNFGPSVNIAPMPQLPGMVPPSAGSLLPPLPAHGPAASGPYASQIYQSQIAPPSVIQQAPTPWWVWLVGGTVAIGLGIGAAVWYAGHTAAPHAPTAPVAAAATPAPAPSPEPASEDPPAPRLIEIKFDSLPAGGVYADGHSAELCRTPCTYNIDPKDGGSTEQRTYIVRSEGYQDGKIVVPLQGTRRAFQVTLERLAVAEPAGQPDAKSGDKADAKPDDKADAKPARDPGKATIAKPRFVPRPVKPAKPTKPDEKAEPSAADPGEKAKPDKKPAEKKPADTKSIDPTDTLDPFRPR